MDLDNTQPDKYDDLYQIIGYTFKEESTLKLALTHRSNSALNNERLEFLGDAALSAIIAKALFEKFPRAKEGQLSRLRSTLVRGATLAEVALELNLSEYVRLGQGERKSGGARRESILADCLEAIIGGILVDAGFDACSKAVVAWFDARMTEEALHKLEKDPKTRLQEYCQARKAGLPEYEIVATDGEVHEQTFFVSCKTSLTDEEVEGVGSSKRTAEQDAASKLLDILGVSSLG